MVRAIKKILLILLVIFLFSSLSRNFFDYRKNLGFYQGYKEDYEKEKKRNVELKTESLKKNSFFEIEKTIRNKLNLSKPNETVVIIPKPIITPTAPTPTPLPNYLQWWNVFLEK